MKILKLNLFSTLFLITISCQNFANAKVEAILGLPVDQNKNLATHIPQTNASEILLSRDQYLLSYNKFRRSPNWVAWQLDLTQIGTSGRSNDFLIDNQLEQYLSETNPSLHAVDSTEFKGSCYDRGHQVPSADRTDSQQDNEATFLMSNMIPQTPYLNRVVWEHLEQYSRDLVQKQGKKLFMIAGPIYDRDMGSIGPKHDIPVPSKNFKIIYILNSNQGAADINASTPVIAVVMPNILQDGSAPETNSAQLCKPLSVAGADRTDWVKYKTTISEIESLSGLTISL
jgi:endonuclease G